VAVAAAVEMGLQIPAELAEQAVAVQVENYPVE
jgi:hypothetical protein